MLQFLAAIASAIMPPVLCDMSLVVYSAVQNLPCSHDQIEECLNRNPVADLVLECSEHFKFNDSADTTPLHMSTPRT